MNVVCLPDGLQLDAAACYPEIAGVERFRRTLTLNPEGKTVVLDEIGTAGKVPVEWHFMLKNKPVIQADMVHMGKLRMIVDPGMDIFAEEIPVEDSRMARSFPGSLWRLTLKDEAGKNHRAEFVFVTEE